MMLRFALIIAVLVPFGARAAVEIQEVTSPGGITHGWWRNPQSRLWRWTSASRAAARLIPKASVARPI